MHSQTARRAEKEKEKADRNLAALRGRGGHALGGGVPGFAVGGLSTSRPHATPLEMSGKKKKLTGRASSVGNGGAQRGV
jgi:hypothetical protein